MVSPGSRPALSAALPGTTSSIVGGGIGWPEVQNKPAITSMANRKLAIGPAATMAARWRSGLWWNETSRSASVMVGTASSGVDAASASPNIFT